jgi:hypothetical protein
MARKLVWDAVGERRFEAGVDRGVLFVMGTNGYGNGVAWNGLTGVSVSPEGADATDLWADNLKYATMRSAETVGATIEAYTYPDEWNECDGSAAVATGVYLHQQNRKTFGFCWRTMIGDDTHTDLSKGYKLHFLYGCTASPSETSYETINDSPDAMTFSWEIDTTPLTVEGYKPTAYLSIDSTEVDAAKLASLEKIIYGEGETEARLPLPAEIITLFSE